MSRRRGEFEHRTSIFEGAFRAWSHLGGLEPEELESRPATELDPLTNPIANDPRVTGKNTTKNPDGTARREYPYEPLPRSGLAHPYVQAILSPWLGPDADNEAIQLGLTTLRTWWQHRRKGESGSAIAALGTEKMKGVVEGYTRHFFTLAHCVVVNEKVQPPRGLLTKMKEREKQNKKKKAAPKKDTMNGMSLEAIRGDLTDPNLTPLEKLHVAQRRQIQNSGGLTSSIPGQQQPSAPIMDMKGKCIPGKLDLPGMVNKVSHAAQRAHHGTGGLVPDGAVSAMDYGDPNTTPVVFVSRNGDIQIAMKVDGITCSHCVKIVETVLRGCNGNKSPISGLLDAAADRDLCSVLLKIDKASNAKRIAHEAARNLSMVGYTATAISMNVVDEGSDPKSRTDLGALSTAFEVVASTSTQDVFDWSTPCTCPDNGVLRGDCARHAQMNTRIFDAFKAREQEVMDYMAGCAMKYGMDCTCGPSCRCKDCPIHGNGSAVAADSNNVAMAPPMNNPPGFRTGAGNEAPIHVDQQMNFSPLPLVPPVAAKPSGSAPSLNPLPLNSATLDGGVTNSSPPSMNFRQQRNSVLSYGNGGLRSSLRHMSITSEMTFGRAMSGLSALSIDWENLDDFDVEVDHSAHINNRRTSIRRSIMSTSSQDKSGEEKSTNNHVSFRV